MLHRSVSSIDSNKEKCSRHQIQGTEKIKAALLRGDECSDRKRKEVKQLNILISLNQTVL